MSFDILPKPTIAVVQAAPVYFDREACIQKVRRLTAQAKVEGADLVVFSESFIPGFPTWVHMIAPMEQHDLFTRMVQSSIEIPNCIKQIIFNLISCIRFRIVIGINCI